MPSTDLQVGNPDTFLGENETMDLSELKDKSFIVAINSGFREEGKFICETIHGPYTFVEMIEEVGTMYQDFQHNAKVFILSKDKTKPPQFLDVCTIDYIEAKYTDIITESFLEGAFEAPYTCKAGLVYADAKKDPRLKPKEEIEEEEI